jgi:fumarylpyruvate hydrolase
VDALDCVYGYAVGIDFTRRDLQAEAKAAGKPWTAAKAFEHSAPVSPIVPAQAIGHPVDGNIWLKVNGEAKQQGDLNQMIWKVPEIIAELSKLFTLAAGDVIMTGTPSGVGPVARGDVVSCGIDGVATLTVTVV